MRKAILTLMMIGLFSFNAGIIAPSITHAATPSPSIDPCSLTSQERKALEGVDLGYCDVKEALPSTWITDIWGLITTSLTYIPRVIGVLALFGLIVTGIMYIMAGGDSDKAAKAQKNIGWIITGVVLFLLLFWIPQVLSEFIKDLPNDKLVPASTDENGIRLTQIKTKNSTIEWPANMPAANLQSLKDQRALAVNERVSININNSKVTPNSLTIQEGTVVVWYNYDTVDHHYKPDPSRPSTTGPTSLTVPAKNYYVQLIDKPGEFHYIDTDLLGPVQITGSIVVTENTAISVPACPATPLDISVINSKISLAGITPVAIPVYSGTTVIWENVDNKAHTITGNWRSTLTDRPGPAPTLLQAGQTLSHTFVNEGTVGVQFVYFDETDPTNQYVVCVFPRP